jgi:hypothetical protein
MKFWVPLAVIARLMCHQEAIARGQHRLTAELTAEVTRWEHRLRAQRSPALWDLALERMVASPIPIRARVGGG